MHDKFKKAKRIVIKISTSILTTPRGAFSNTNLDRLSKEVLELIKEQKEVVLVSSGAIGLGMEVCGFKRRPVKMPQLQACAAIGQGKLMHAYEEFFSKRGLHTAQVLLTREGLEKRDRFLSASHTFAELLKMKMIPIVNENDTVSTEEIGFGDNDRLSVHVAHLVHADLLILLSDVDGFFLKDGSRVRQVTSIHEIKTELVKHVADVKKEKNVGGMKAKLNAAMTAMDLGIPLFMVNGHKKGMIKRLLNAEDVGTLFNPAMKKRSARQMWISFSAPRKGALIVDEGAVKILREKKVSLLPRGLVRFRGDFDPGQVVELEGLDGVVFGRGIVRYGSQDIKKIIGKKTDEMESILGYKCHHEVVHRNDLVIWE